jgi:zona occludens toxin
MAINAYVGVPGSGKTYEVVANVILPAIKAGRRVVTNVPGIKSDAIWAYLDLANPDADARYGEVVYKSNEEILAADFFPENGSGFVGGGDLVVLDECWRFFRTWADVPPRLKSFLTEHRHFTNAEGVSCDIALVTQNLNLICRQVRGLVELVVHMVKMKKLGRPKNYTVHLFSGNTMARRQPDTIKVCKYDPAVFALYSSYEGKGGNEATMDKRQNILGGAFFSIAVPVALLVAGLGAWYAYGWFTASQGPQTKPADTKALPKGSGPVPGPAVAGVRASGSDVSESDWRLAGWLDVKGTKYVYLERGGQRRTLVDPPLFNYRGRLAEGVLDGKRISEWTGRKAGDAVESPSLALPALPGK